MKKEKIENGQRLCLNNAISLLKSSKILIENKQYGHSIALSITGIEEIGKYTILGTFKRNKTRAVWDLLHGIFRNHTKKLGIALFAMDTLRHVLSNGGDFSEKEIDRLKKKSENMNLETTKHSCLYVEYKKKEFCKDDTWNKEEAESHL